MKNIKTILSIAVLFVTINAYSQYYPVLSTTNQAFTATDNNYMEKGNYAKDIGNIRDQLVGTWRYQTPSITLELKIEKRDKEFYETNFSRYRFMDLIYIKYKLVKNGVTLHNSLNTVLPITISNTLNTFYSLNFVSYGFYQNNTYTFRGFINDYYRQVLCDYTLQKTTINGQDKLLLDISDGNYRKYGDKSMYAPGIDLFSLPLEPIVLNKIP